uniref:Uncharacterized protein n=1 Tax=viral metagenome TaxID=1070528 RepID=A0A6C0IFZ7_9ZZZZ
MDSEGNPLQMGKYYRLPNLPGVISFHNRPSQYIGLNGHEPGSYLFKKKQLNGENRIEERRIDTEQQRPTLYPYVSLTDDEFEIDGGKRKSKRKSKKSKRKSKKSKRKSRRN